MGRVHDKPTLARQTTLRCDDTGEVFVFRSISRASTRVNASTDTLRRAARTGEVIRARNGSVWRVLNIGGVI